MKQPIFSELLIYGSYKINFAQAIVSENVCLSQMASPAGAVFSNKLQIQIYFK